MPLLMLCCELVAAYFRTVYYFFRIYYSFLAYSTETDTPLTLDMTV